MKQQVLDETFEIVPVVVFPDNLPKTIRRINDRLAELGLEKIAHIVTFPSQKTGDFSQFFPAFDAYFKNHPELGIALSEAVTIYRISTPFDLVPNARAAIKPETPILNIGEHHSILFPPATSLNINDRHMGLSATEYGIKLTSASKDQSHELQKLHNKNFLNDVLGKDQDAMTSQLKQMELIPSYLQSKEATAVMIQTFCSPKMMGTKTPIFYVNQGAFDLNMLDHTFLLSQGYDGVELNNNGKLTIMNFNNSAAEPKKPIKIFCGYDLDDHDFDILFSAATRFAGCSGDNSLEKVLSHKLLPILQVRDWKVLFSHDFYQIIRNYSSSKELLKYFELMNQIHSPSSITGLSKKLQSLNYNEILKEWELVVAQIHKYHNFYDQLPRITNEALLHFAAASGDLNEVKRLSTLPINLNIPNNQGVTPIQLATLKGHKEVVGFLITSTIKLSPAQEKIFTKLITNADDVKDGVINIVEYSKSIADKRTETFIEQVINGLKNVDQSNLKELNTMLLKYASEYIKKFGFERKDLFLCQMNFILVTLQSLDPKLIKEFLTTKIDTHINQDNEARDLLISAIRNAKSEYATFFDSQKSNFTYGLWNRHGKGGQKRANAISTQDDINFHDLLFSLNDYLQFDTVFEKTKCIPNSFSTYLLQELQKSEYDNLRIFLNIPTRVGFNYQTEGSLAQTVRDQDFARLKENINLHEHRNNPHFNKKLMQADKQNQIL